MPSLSTDDSTTLESSTMKRLRSVDENQKVASLLVDLHSPDQPNDTVPDKKHKSDNGVVDPPQSIQQLKDQLTRERLRADEIEIQYYDLLHKLKLICSSHNMYDINTTNITNNKTHAQLYRYIQSLQCVLNNEMIQCETIEQQRKQQLYQQMSSDRNTTNNTNTMHTTASNGTIHELHDSTHNTSNNKRSGSYGYYCRPSRFIGHLAKEPVAISWANVKKQYTVSKRETTLMSTTERNQLLPVPVRIMGIPTDRTNLYIVAKDVCQLIHIRKANVARSIGQFSDREKARMPVLCKRSNKIDSTHVLIVLTLDGVKRLLTSSRSALAPIVLDWIMKQIDALVESAQNGTLDLSQSADLHQYDSIELDTADMDDHIDDDEDDEDTELNIPQVQRQRSASPPPDMPSHRMTKLQTKSNTTQNKHKSTIKRVKSDSRLSNTIVSHDQLPLLEPTSISSTPLSISPVMSHSDIESVQSNTNTQQLQYHPIVPAYIVQQQINHNHNTMQAIPQRSNVPVYALPVHSVPQYQFMRGDVLHHQQPYNNLSYITPQSLIYHPAH